MKHFTKVRNISLVLVFTFLCLKDVHSQNRTIIEYEVDKNATPAKSKLGVKNLIKINPLLFFRGDIPFYYEHELSERVGIEFGLGVTLKDFLASYTTVEDEAIAAGVVVKTKLGVSANVGIRYYATNYVYQPEGVYFAADYRFQKYNSLIESGGNIIYNKSITEINNDGRFIVGWVSHIDENVFMDYYAGVGIRSKTYDKVAYIDNPPVNLLGITNESELLPFFSLGFKIGIDF